MRSRLPRLWLLVAPLTLACATPPDVSGEIQAYADLVSDVNSLLCECAQLLGYSDSIQCSEAMGPVGPGARQCLATVVDGHEDAAKAYLDCANAAYETYVHCLQTNVSCESGIYTDCTNDHEGRLATCPLMPVGVQSAFEACAD